jgi:hypothetical protein
MATTPPPKTRSKALAAWAAVLGGLFGAHAFYLRGWSSPWGWAHWPFTLAGWIGWQRVQAYGVDDRASWVLLPLGGLSIAAAMLAAIVIGLTPDEKWNERVNAGTAPGRPSGWAVVIAVVVALLLGTVAMLSSVTYSLQRYFEVQIESPR